MAKDMGGFMKSFAGNLGSNLSGIGLAGNPLSGIGMLQKLMGGHGGGGADQGEETQNPGQKMFGMDKDNKPQGGNTFLQKFGGSLSDQLFQRAMMGFMGR